LLRGYCAFCNGPLHRTEEIMGIGGAYDVDVCRLCWLTSMTSQEVTSDASSVASDGAVRAAFAVLDPAFANSTENTAATSTWLPRVWIDGEGWPVAYVDAPSSGQRTIDGAVVWYREVDGAEGQDTCCCGDNMEGHAFESHSPQSMADNARWNYVRELAVIFGAADAPVDPFGAA